jgi:HSP20 family protein
MPIREFEGWMWAEACEMLNQADRLHRQFFKPALMNVKPATWEPPVDVYESPYEFKIMIALPGVMPEHLSVRLEQDQLIIEGQRYRFACAESQIRRLEIPYGRFERCIQFPDGRYEIQTRELVQGCLLISLRKV